MGAVAAFDYKDPDCAEKIKQYTNGELKYIWDTISLPPTAKICAEVIAPGGTYGRVIRVEVPRANVKCTYSNGDTAFGEPVKKGLDHWPDNSEDFKFCKRWIEIVEPLLHEGQLKAHPTRVEQGLENVLDGLDMLRHDEVSAQKMVYVL